MSEKLTVQTEIDNSELHNDLRELIDSIKSANKKIKTDTNNTGKEIQTAQSKFWKGIADNQKGKIKEMVLNFVGIQAAIKLASAGIKFLSDAVVNAGLKTDKFNTAMDGISKTIGTVLLPYVQSVVDFITKNADTIGTVVGKIINYFTGTIKLLFGGISTFITWLMQGVQYAVMLITNLVLAVDKFNKVLPKKMQQTWITDAADGMLKFNNGFVDLIDNSKKANAELLKSGVNDFVKDIDVKKGVPEKKKEEKEEKKSEVQTSEVQTYESFLAEQEAFLKRDAEIREEYQKKKQEHAYDIQAEALKATLDNQQAEEKALKEHLAIVAAIEKEAADAAQKEKDMREKADKKMQQSIIQTATESAQKMYALGVENNKKTKENAIKNAIINSMIAQGGAAASIWTGGGTPYEKIAETIATAIALNAALAVQVATISKQNFASGGIVGGNSLTGDRVPVNVNSREMILNMEQQKQLFNMANGQGGSSNAAINVTINDHSGNMTETFRKSLRGVGSERLISDLRRELRLA